MCADGLAGAVGRSPGRNPSESNLAGPERKLDAHLLAGDEEGAHGVVEAESERRAAASSATDPAQHLELGNLRDDWCASRPVASVEEAAAEAGACSSASMNALGGGSSIRPLGCSNASEPANECPEKRRSEGSQRRMARARRRRRMQVGVQCGAEEELELLPELQWPRPSAARVRVREEREQLAVGGALAFW